MAKRDEINSTEQLLELIRSDNSKDYDDYAGPSSRSGRDRLKAFFSNPLSFRRAITVGVDLGHDDLKIVKINRLSDNKFELLDYSRVPFDPNISRDSEEFYRFLRPVLFDFCGDQKNVDIWCTISSARVETHQIRIPKVSTKQLPNTVYWTYQKDSSFNEKEKIFDFEILGDIEDSGTTKTDVMAYTIPLEEVNALKALFLKAGFSLTGISIVPYAFQTLLRTHRIETDEENVSSLYIGRDWSRIDVFSNGNLMLSRGIKAGIRTMIEALRKGIEGIQRELSLVKAPNNDTRRIRAVKRKLNLHFEKAQQHFFGLIHDSSSSDPKTSEIGARSEIAAREESIFKMILPALQRLVRQVERTLKHYALNYENAPVGKIYISSGVRPHQRILGHIEDELGLPTEAINPFAASANFLTMMPWPDSVSEQSSYAPAMGMALASNSITPNFLYTYKEKQKTLRGQRVTRGVFAGFFLVIAICVGITFWQGLQIKQKQSQKDDLQRQLASKQPRIDKNVILKLLDQYRAKHKSVIGLSKTYHDLAIISEISSLTPANIRLLSIAADLGALPAKENEDSKQILVLDGIIIGERLNLESRLAEYLMELKNSPLFDQPAINRKSFEFYENREVLRFTAVLNLI